MNSTDRELYQVLGIDTVLQIVGMACPDCQAKMRGMLSRAKFKPAPDSLAGIISEVSAERFMTLEALMSKNNGRQVVDARRQIAVRARQVGYSYPAIAAALGKHHTTIMHLVRTADDQRKPHTDL